MENKIIQDGLMDLEIYLKKLEQIQERLKDNTIIIDELDSKDKEKLIKSNELNIDIINELINKVKKFKNKVGSNLI